MIAWNQLQNWLESLFQRGRGKEPAPDLHPRVLLITYNPIIDSAGRQRLNKVLQWNDPNELCRTYIADLREASGGYVAYEIVERIEVDAWPAKEGASNAQSARVSSLTSQKGPMLRPSILVRSKQPIACSGV